MHYLSKFFKKVSLKGLIVHIIGLAVSMSIIWGVSYLILVTFSIQDSIVATPDAFSNQGKLSTSTLKSKIGQGTSTATSTKTKIKK